MPWESAKTAEITIRVLPSTSATRRRDCTAGSPMDISPREVVLSVARETADFLRSGRSEEDALRLIDRQRVPR